MSTAGNAIVCHGIVQDLDITGIGVRSTFYVTSILLVVNTSIPGCDVRGPCWTLVFTNLALLISALIQAANKTISFYNALTVIYLCYLHSLSFLFVPNILRWAHRKNMDETLHLLSLQHFVFLHLFALLVVHTKKSFGPQPECNSEVDESFSVGFWTIIISILLPDNRHALKRISHIIGINGTAGVQTFLRNHEWKVGLPLFVVFWVSMVVSIEKTILIDSVIHNGPRFTASFGQIFPVATIGIPISSIYFDVRAWLRRRTIKGTPPMAAQDTLNVSAVVYDNDAYLAYVMTVDEESLGADAIHSSTIPTLPPVDTQTTTSTMTVPPGDETEKTLDIMSSSQFQMQTQSNTTSTLPPANVTEITTSTTPPGDEQETTLGVIGSGQTGEVDVRAPDSQTKTPEHTEAPPQIDQLASLAGFLRGRELLHRREALHNREF